MSTYVDPSKGKATSKDLQNQNNNKTVPLRIPSEVEYSNRYISEGQPKNTQLPNFTNPDNTFNFQEADSFFNEQKNNNFLSTFLDRGTWQNSVLANAYHTNPNDPINFMKQSADAVFGNSAISSLDYFEKIYKEDSSFKGIIDHYYQKGDVGGMVSALNEFASVYQPWHEKLGNGFKQSIMDASLMVWDVLPAISSLLSTGVRGLGSIAEAVGWDNNYNFQDIEPGKVFETLKYDHLLGDWARYSSDARTQTREGNKIFLSEGEQNDPWRLSVGNISQNLIGQYGATIGFMVLTAGMGGLASGLKGAGALGEATNSFKTLAKAGRFLDKNAGIIMGTYEGFVEGSTAAEDYIKQGKELLENNYRTQLGTLFYKELNKNGLNINTESIYDVSADAYDPSKWAKYGIDISNLPEYQNIQKYKEDGLVKLDKHAFQVFGTTLALNSVINGWANKYTLTPIYEKSSGFLSKKGLKFGKDGLIKSSNTKFWNQPFVRAVSSVGAEGIEEWAQGGISEVATSISNDALDRFTAQRFDKNNSALIRGDWEIIGHSLLNGVKYLTDPNKGLYDFALGAITTGTLVTPTLKRNVDRASKKTWWGKNVGGYIGLNYMPLVAFKQAKERMNTRDELVKEWNNAMSDPSNSEKIQLITASMAYNNLIKDDNSASEMSIFEIKNTKLGQMLNSYSLAKELGIEKEYKSMLSSQNAKLEKAIKDENFDAVSEHLNQAIISGMVTTEELTAENDPDGSRKKEILETIQKNSSKMIKKLDEIDKVAKFVNENYGSLGMDTATRSGLMYGYLLKDDWKKRKSELHSKLNSANIENIALEIDKNSGNERVASTVLKSTKELLKFGKNYSDAVKNIGKLQQELSKNNDVIKSEMLKYREIYKNSDVSSKEREVARQKYNFLDKQLKQLKIETDKWQESLNIISKNKELFTKNEDGIIKDIDDISLSMSDFNSLSNEDKHTILSHANKGIYNNKFTNDLKVFTDKVNIDFTKDNKMSYETVLTDAKDIDISLNSIDSRLAKYLYNPGKAMQDKQILEYREKMAKIEDAANSEVERITALDDVNSQAEIVVLRDAVKNLENKEKSQLTDEELIKINTLAKIDKQLAIKSKLSDALDKLEPLQRRLDSFAEILDASQDKYDAFEANFLYILYGKLLNINKDVSELSIDNIISILNSTEGLTEEEIRTGIPNLLTKVIEETVQAVKDMNEDIPELAGTEFEATGVDLIPDKYVVSENEVSEYKDGLIDVGNGYVAPQPIYELAQDVITLAKEIRDTENSLTDSNKTKTKEVAKESTVEEEELLAPEIPIKDTTALPTGEDLENAEVIDDDFKKKNPTQENTSQKPVDIVEEIVDEDIEEEDITPEVVEDIDENLEIDLEEAESYLMGFYLDKLKNSTLKNSIIWNSRAFYNGNRNNPVMEYLKLHTVQEYLCSGRLQYYYPNSEGNPTPVYFVADRTLYENIKKDIENKGETYSTQRHFPVVAVVKDPQGKLNIDGENYQVLTLYTGNVDKQNDSSINTIIFNTAKLLEDNPDKNLAILKNEDSSFVYTYPVPSAIKSGFSDVSKIHVQAINAELDEDAAAKIGINKVYKNRIPLIELNSSLDIGQYSIFSESGKLIDDNFELAEIELPLKNSIGQVVKQDNKVLVLQHKNSTAPNERIHIYGHYVTTYKGWGDILSSMLVDISEAKTPEEIDQRKKALLYFIQNDILKTFAGKQLYKSILDIIEEYNTENPFEREINGIARNIKSKEDIASDLGKAIKRWFVYGTEDLTVIASQKTDNSDIEHIELYDVPKGRSARVSENAKIFKSEEWVGLNETERKLEAARVVARLLTIQGTKFRVSNSDLLKNPSDNSESIQTKENYLATLLKDGILYTTRSQIKRVSKEAEKGERAANKRSEETNSDKYTWKYSVGVLALDPESREEYDNITKIQDTVVNTNDPIIKEAEIIDTEITSKETIQDNQKLEDDKNTDVDDISDILDGWSGTKNMSVSENKETFDKMNIAEEYNFLREMLPFLFDEKSEPMDDAIRIVNAGIEITRKSMNADGEVSDKKIGEAWGKYRNGKIKLSTTAPRGISLHEGVHLVLDLFLDATEKHNLLTEVASKMEKNKNGNSPTLEDAEEALANWWMLSKTDQTNDKGIFYKDKFLKNSKYKKIVYYIKSLLKLPVSSAREFFYRLNNNFYTTSATSYKNYVDSNIDKFSKVPIKESVVDSDLELDKVSDKISINSLIALGKITYTNDEGKPCSECGGVTEGFEEGHSWSLLQKFKGDTHEEGGIDTYIELNDSSIMGIEVEDKELKLKNSKGDIAIIPTKYSIEVADMIKGKCWKCLDKLISTLPLIIA